MTFLPRLSAQSQADSQKQRSKLDPAAPEFTPLNILSYASTVNSEPSPVDGTFPIDSNQAPRKEQQTEFINRTGSKAEGNPPDDAENGTTCHDGMLKPSQFQANGRRTDDLAKEAADDDKKSLPGRDGRHEKSAELSKYKRPRCSIGVKSKSESAMEGSSGDVQS